MRHYDDDVRGEFLLNKMMSAWWYLSCTLILQTMVQTGAPADTLF